MKRGFASPCVHSAPHPELVEGGDDAPGAAPALARSPSEVLEAARRLAGRLAFRCRRRELADDRADEAVGLRQAEDIVDAVCLAPCHKRLAREAAVGTQHDAHLRPARTDLRDDARRLLDRARRRIDVGGPQLRRQQVATAEDVERQVTVATIVAVEKPPFLLAVQRVVGGVEIEDDLLGRRLVRLQKKRDEQIFDGDRIMGDLVIARRLRPAQLQTVQRRLAGHRRAVLAPCRQLAGEDRHHRIVAQLVVIVDILIAERQPKHTLPDQRRHKVLYQLRTAMIAEAPGETINQLDRTIRRSQQQRPGVRADRAAVKPGHHDTAFHRCKLEQFRATLCRHRGISLDQSKLLRHNKFLRVRAPVHSHCVRYPG